jgi:hypothetical protein
MAPLRHSSWIEAMITIHCPLSTDRCPLSPIHCHRHSSELEGLATRDICAYLHELERLLTNTYVKAYIFCC